MKPDRRNVTLARGTMLAALFAVAVTITACGGGGAPQPTDNSNPVVAIGSAPNSPGASYELTGVALDNVGVTGVSYTLGGGAAQELTLSNNIFSATLTLSPGGNEITVTASDAAGNTGSDSITVQYAAPPAGATGSEAVAARGESITISGSNFGEGGGVDIGGVAATIDSWSDAAIEVTIPQDAANGPQTVTVTTPQGESSFELFVGFAYESGTLTELADLALPPGTAVLLSAGTYGMGTGTEIMLDNLSLYGRGEGVTIVNTGALPRALLLFADVGFDLVLRDLTLQTGVTLVSPSLPGPVAPSGATTTGLESMSAADLLAAARAAAAGQFAAMSGMLQPQAGGHGTFSMIDVAIEEIGNGLGFVTANPVIGVPLLYSGDVYLERVTQEGVTSAFGIFVGGDITARSVNVDVIGSTLVGFNGFVDISDSSFLGSIGGGLASLGVVHGRGLRFVNSDFRNFGDGLILAPAAIAFGGGLALPAGGPVEITGSTFHSFDDPTLLTDGGNLLLGAVSGPAYFHDNTFIAHGEVVLGVSGGSAAFYGNELTIGSATILTSPLVLELVDMLGHVEFVDNDVVWTNEGSLVLLGNNDFVVSDNTFTGNGSGTALEIVQYSDNQLLDVVVQDNDFVDFENALRIELLGVVAEPFDLALNGNNFDFDINAMGKVAVLVHVVNATLDVDGNRWGGETNTTTLNSWIDELGTTAPGIMEITVALP